MGGGRRGSPFGASLELNGDRTGYVLDERGIAQGGIRTPWVDVPTAVMGGLGQSASLSPCCSVVPSPSTTPPCRRCIPAGKTSIWSGSTTSLDATIAAGFLLEEDRMEILAVAAHSFPRRLADG